MDVMDGGFVSEDCTKDEIDAKVAEIISWHDGKTSRINTPTIRLITPEERTRIMNSDMCFWSRQLSKMTYKAAERMRQNNC
jgi:hypothetical protein